MTFDFVNMDIRFKSWTRIGMLITSPDSASFALMYVDNLYVPTLTNSTKPFLLHFSFPSKG